MYMPTLFPVPLFPRCLGLEVAEAFASRAAEDENNGSDAAPGDRANADTEPVVPFDPNKKDGVSIVIVDAALKSSLTKDPSMAGVRPGNGGVWGGGSEEG